MPRANAPQQRLVLGYEICPASTADCKKQDETQKQEHDFSLFCKVELQRELVEFFLLLKYLNFWIASLVMQQLIRISHLFDKP